MTTPPLSPAAAAVLAAIHAAPDNTRDNHRASVAAALRALADCDWIQEEHTVTEEGFDGYRTKIVRYISVDDMHAVVDELDPAPWPALTSASPSTPSSPFAAWKASPSPSPSASPAGSSPALIASHPPSPTGFTVLNDTTRCHGAYDPPLGTGYAQLMPPCLDCLRRTTVRLDGLLYSYMCPPEFTADCPYRITPDPA